MRITLLIMLAFVLFGGLGVLFVVYKTQEDVARQYSQAAEETMVDVAQVLAALLEEDVEDGVIRVENFRAGFEQAHRREFEAKIYQMIKNRLHTHVYVTDAKGIVLFDSEDGMREGMNYADKRDVHLTLQGRYGARATREIADDSRTTVFYVAAPVRWQGETVGVLSVSRPETAMAIFVDETRALIARTGATAGALMLVIGMMWVYWLLSPIGELTKSARKVKAGARTALPVSGFAELRSLGNSLEEMRKELEGRQYVESYVQALTHEIKSPISAIQGAAELLEDETMPVEQRKRFLENIQAETARCEEIVRRLVQLAALESQHALDRVEPVDLGELLRSEADALQARMEAKAIQLNLRLPSAEQGETSPATVIRGDRLALQLAVRNLLANAIDFSPQGGTIDLGLELPELSTGKSKSKGRGRGREEIRSVHCVVEDEGPGIPEYAKGRVFERFYSLRQSVTGRKGSGLGLCFVREAATLHGGSIELQKRSPSGVRAILSLPV